MTDPMPALALSITLGPHPDLTSLAGLDYGGKS